MFKPNDIIFYQKNGICEIIDLSTHTISTMTKNYYILRPISDQRTRLYIPCDNQILVSQMKKLITKEELIKILSQVSSHPSIWIEDRNARKEMFQNILHHGDCLENITMVKTINEKRTELTSKRKKLSAADDLIYRDACKMLMETISYILDIPKEDVLTYIFEDKA